jgi:hypothetical protein
MTDQDCCYSTCRHLKANGLRCESPALKGEPLCYYHTNLHANHPAPLTAHKMVRDWGQAIEEGIRIGGEDPYQIARVYPKQNEYNFPPLEDAESIQLAASMLFHAIAQGQIHAPRARTLVQALSVANDSLRIRRLTPPVAPSTLVRVVDRTPEGVAIAPADSDDTTLIPLPPSHTSPSLSSPSAPCLSSRALGERSESKGEQSASPTAEPASQPESNEDLTHNPHQ